MMKSRFLPVLILALLSAAAPVANTMPSWYGVSGLYRVLDARSPSQGSYSTFLSTSYEFTRVWDRFRFTPPGYPQVDTVLTVRDTEHYAEGTFMVGYAVRDNIEAALTICYRLNAYQYQQIEPRKDYVGYFDASWGLGDFRASVKYSYQLKDWLYVGGAGWFSLPLNTTWADTAADYDGYWNKDDVRIQVRRPFLTTGKPAFGVMALCTAEYSPIVGHANVGFSYYSQEYYDCTMGLVSQTDPVIDFGVGVEAPTSLGVPFVEFSGRYLTARSGSEGYGMPARICGGFRVTEETGNYLDLIGIIGLTKHDRDLADPYRTGELPVPEGIPGSWGIMIAMGFDRELVGGGSTSGTIGGTILDALTGAPVAATITFVDSDHSPVTTNPETGIFSVQMPAGLYAVRIEAPGYTPGSVTVSVEGGGQTPADVLLSPAGGTLSGFVRDRDTGAPLQAIISAAGTDASVSSNPSGDYSLDLPAGSWSVSAQLQGYATATQTVTVTTGSSASADFTMTPALVSGQVLTFANIYFDSGSSTIKSSSYGVLDDIVQLLQQNPDVNVEIVGHTDSDGSESSNQTLSEQRAQSVANYLTQRGIPSSRLSTSGRGETSPIATNSTPEGKAQNRRIEFHVR